MIRSSSDKSILHQHAHRAIISQSTLVVGELSATPLATPSTGTGAIAAAHSSQTVEHTCPQSMTCATFERHLRILLLSRKADKHLLQLCLANVVA